LPPKKDVNVLPWINVQRVILPVLRNRDARCAAIFIELKAAKRADVQKNVDVSL